MPPLKGYFSMIAVGRLVFICVIAVCAWLFRPVALANDVLEVREPSRAPYKILHIMSHHSPWRWTDGQFQGFKDGLGSVEAEYRVLQLDAKRNSDPAHLEARGQEARALIDTWQPDLVYTSDDEAQQYVSRHYINADIPFVFSGVNKDPSTYGLRNARNHTGVLEQEHFIESVRLLQQMVPNITRLAIVFDDSEMWLPVQDRMRDRLSELSGVESVAWDTIATYADYQQKISEYQETVDAIALIGIFNFKDDKGANVPYQDVLRWTAENSRLPDFGFWVDRVHYGSLASVTVSEHEQGLAAGRLARSILVDGISPDSLPMATTTKGVPVISLARANALGIPLRSSLLLSAHIVSSYEWQK